MKKTLLTALILNVLLMTGSASALTEDLIADGGGEYLDVGDVHVTSDGTNLIVTFTTTGGWEMTATHLGIRTATYDGINVKKNGNVSVGKLAAGGDKTGIVHDPPVTTYTYTISLADIEAEPDDTIDVAAHADVRLWLNAGLDEIPGNEDDVYREETSWGEGPQFDLDRNWAMYIVYTIPLYPCAPEIVEVSYLNSVWGYMQVSWASGCEEPYPVEYYLYLSFNDGPYNLEYGPTIGTFYEHSITASPDDKYCYVVVAVYTDGPHDGNESEESEPVCYTH